MSSRPPPPKALHWATSSQQVEALFQFIEDQCWKALANVYRIKKANCFAITSDGRIVGAESLATARKVRNVSKIAKIWVLPEEIQKAHAKFGAPFDDFRVDAERFERAAAAANCLFNLQEARIAIKNGHAQLTAENIVRLWVNSAFAGFALNLDPLASWLFQKDKEASGGARDANARKAAKAEQRNRQINEYIRAKIAEGTRYDIVVRLMTRNEDSWPVNLGRPISEKRLREIAPAKSFRSARASEK